MAKNHLETKYIFDLTGFEALKQPWEKLLEQNEIDDVFLTWEWLTAWWKCYGKDKQLWLVTLWNEHELVGCAPLMLVTTRVAGINYRVLQTLSSPECDVSGLLVKNGDKQLLQVLLNSILERSSQWDLLYLKELQYNTSQTTQILDLLKEFKLNFFLKTREHYYIPVQGEWETYLKTLSKNTRKNLTRRRKRAEEVGKLSFERIRGNAINLEHFDKIFKINELGHFPELYVAKQDRDFHYELATRMQLKDWINIDILSINDTPAAFQYGFFYKGRYEDWRGSFDTSYHQLSLGSLLLSMSLERLFKDGIREHDFLRGSYDYKMIWNSHSRNFIKIHISSPKSRIAFVTYILIPKIKHWLKSKIKMALPIPEGKTPKMGKSEKNQSDSTKQTE